MIANLRKRVLSRITRLMYAPAITVQHSTQLTRCGTEYGGWTFELSPGLQDSVIVSCGLGEDASFDVEFAARFNAKVIIVDPTPRAIRHFDAIQERVGQPAIQSHVQGGKEPAESYDLRKIVKDTLILERSALWVENTRLKFYAPRNPDHVSHSIVNYQNNYSQNTSHIEVEAITLETLLSKYQIKALPLMKIDIEGAEIKVILDMLKKSIYVRQLLVEFDEMNCPSARSKSNVEKTDRILRQAGYICRYFDGHTNFLYVLR